MTELTFITAAIRALHRDIEVAGVIVVWLC